MNKFIYVFSQSDRDKLLSAGYVLLTEDLSAGVYVFINDGHRNFSSEDVRFTLSDILTF